MTLREILRGCWFAHATDPHTVVVEGRTSFECQRCGATWPILPEQGNFRPWIARLRRERKAKRAALRATLPQIKKRA